MTLEEGQTINELKRKGSVDTMQGKTRHSLTIKKDKPSFTWKFRMPIKEACLLEEDLNKGIPSGRTTINKPTDYWLTIHRERELVRSTLAELAKTAVVPVIELCKTELGLQQIQNALACSGWVIMSTETHRLLREAK